MRILESIGLVTVPKIKGSRQGTPPTRPGRPPGLFCCSVLRIFSDEVPSVLAVAHEGPMKLSDIELIAKDAEKACVAVMNRPEDGLAREELFDTLGRVVDPAFIETDPTRGGRLNDLVQQASVWGDIVRSRINLSRQAGPGEASVPSIEHPTRELQRVLYALLDELGALPSRAPPLARRSR